MISENGLKMRSRRSSNMIIKKLRQCLTACMAALPSTVRTLIWPEVSSIIQVSSTQSADRKSTINSSQLTNRRSRKSRKSPPEAHLRLRCPAVSLSSVTSIQTVLCWAIIRHTILIIMRIRTQSHRYLRSTTASWTTSRYLGSRRCSKISIIRRLSATTSQSMVIYSLIITTMRTWTSSTKTWT